MVEIEERWKASNIIAHYLSKSAQELCNNKLRDNYERCLINVLTKDSPNVNVKDCKRLGKTTAGQSRPLQIKLPSADDVSAVSKSYRRQNNVSLNRDLTLRSVINVILFVKNTATDLLERKNYCSQIASQKYVLSDKKTCLNLAAIKCRKFCYYRSKYTRSVH